MDRATLRRSARQAKHWIASRLSLSKYAAIVAAAALFSGTAPAQAALPSKVPPTVPQGTAGPCQFVLGFKALHDSMPDVVGSCIVDQGFALNGDAQQDTLKGLLVWRKSDNFTAFTDGYWTWVSGPKGVQKRLNTQRFPWEAGSSPYSAGAAGYDISYPQCSNGGAPSRSFGVIGINGGRPFSDNNCAGAEFGWAAAGGTTPALYLNTGYLDKYASKISGACQASVPSSINGSYAQAWAIGCSEAEYSVARQPSNPSMWWLDVETDNSWSSTDLALNRETLQGAVTYLQQNTSTAVGIYSNPHWWGVITGGNWTPAGLTGSWVAPGRANSSNAASFCSSGFSSAPVFLVQYTINNIDTDYAC